MTSRQLFKRWRGASLMERREVEGLFRARTMPIRLPTEEAFIWALVDWLEDIENRLAKQPKAARTKKAA